jgi:hypothetical protein
VWARTVPMWLSPPPCPHHPYRCCPKVDKRRRAGYGRHRPDATASGALCDQVVPSFLHTAHIFVKLFCCFLDFFLWPAFGNIWVLSLIMSDAQMRRLHCPHHHASTPSAIFFTSLVMGNVSCSAATTRTTSTTKVSLCQHGAQHGAQDTSWNGQKRIPRPKGQSTFCCCIHVMMPV